MATWMAINAPAVHAASPVDAAVAAASDEPWTRWTQGGGYLYGVVDAAGSVDLPCRSDALDLESAQMPDGTGLAARATDAGVRVELGAASGGAPAGVRFRLR
jgi:alpha-L-fucosidase